MEVNLHYVFMHVHIQSDTSSLILMNIKNHASGCIAFLSKNQHKNKPRKYVNAIAYMHIKYTQTFVNIKYGHEHEI